MAVSLALFAVRKDLLNEYWLASVGARFAGMTASSVLAASCLGAIPLSMVHLVVVALSVDVVALLHAFSGALTNVVRATMLVLANLVSSSAMVMARRVVAILARCGTNANFVTHLVA